MTTDRFVSFITGCVHIFDDIIGRKKKEETNLNLYCTKTFFFFKFELPSIKVNVIGYWCYLLCSINSFPGQSFKVSSDLHLGRCILGIIVYKPYPETIACINNSCIGFRHLLCIHILLDQSHLNWNEIFWEIICQLC